MRNYIAAHPWRTIGFALLYCVPLACVFATISFSEEEAARQYIAQTMNRPAAPLPPLPVIHDVEWPDIVLRRDPFQPLAKSTNKATQNPNHSSPPAPRRLRGLTSSSPDTNLYVLDGGVVPQGG